MKNVIKWIIIVVLVAIFAIDVAGFWKYKLNGTKYVVPASSEEDTGSEVPAEESDTTKYAELSSSDFKNNEKFVIKTIDSEDDGTYTVKGMIYEEYVFSQAEYTNIKNGKEVEIFGIKYSKDKVQNNKITLKSKDENALDLYVLYDTKTKKYILKDVASDNIVYKNIEKYVKLNLAGTVTFNQVLNGKTTKSTLKDQIDNHQKLEKASSTLNDNKCTLTFDKNGKCTAITETIA